MAGDNPLRAAGELATVRDFVRYAVSRFSEAGLFFGHGTGSAFDEAVFIVLEALHLPIDQIDPFWDARLLADERACLVELIEQRVATRKPAAYLLGRAYIQGMPFAVDERVIVPRSYLGELLFSDILTGNDEAFGLIAEPDGVERILDLCTGSGCLAVLAARIFPDAAVDAVDCSAGALEVARVNVEDHGLDDRVVLLEGNVYEPVAGRRYDLILANPPYVTAAAMAALAPEYRHEPTLALAGGEDGLDIVRRIVDGAAAHLTPGGGLLCEVGLARDRLDEAYPNLPFLWLDTAESSGEVFWITREHLVG